MSETPSNLVEFAFNNLQEQIINGTFKAEEKLVISKLAKGYGISAIPIREALAKLNAIGFIQFKQNQGYRVSPHLDRSGFIELFESRLMLDLAAAPGVLANITEIEIKQLKSINDTIASRKYGTKRYTEFQHFMVLNSKFHQQFITFANNRFLNKLYEDLHTEMFISRHIINSGISFKGLIHAHYDILEALEQRDLKQLRRCLIDHLNDGLNLIFDYRHGLTLNPLS